VNRRARRPDPLLEWFLGTDDTRISLVCGMALGLLVFLGLAAVVAATNLDASVAFVVFAVAVAALAWWVAPVGALGIAAMAFLFIDGFVLNRGGNLTWHDRDDALRLATLLVIALLVSNSSQDRRARLRRKRIRAALAGRGPKF